MSCTRRDFLAGIAISAAATGSSPAATGGEAPAMREARILARRRRRRIIFNNDGDDIWAPGANTAEQFLAVRHTPLLGTQVDSIFYCTTQSFNRFTHNTQVAEKFLSREGRFQGNNLEKFLDEGTDGLKLSSEFARRNGLESFWTLRMNDIHDAWTPAFLSQWKQQDPRRVMSSYERVRQFDDRRRLWSLVDFEHPDVEPALLAAIGEVLANYHLSGIELDFMRAPFFFRSSYAGLPATPEQTAVLTKLVRGVRKLVEQHSSAQQRPILLAARVPVSIELCAKIGIDIASWLQEDWLDVLTLGGGYIAFDSPLKRLAQSAGQLQVPVYACLSQSGLMYRAPRGDERQAPEAWFGAARRMWAEGVDGMYTFNLFTDSAEQREYARDVLSTIGSPATLAQRDAMYCISDAGWWMPAHYWARDAEDYSGALPAELAAGEYTRLYMEVAEDLRGADFGVTAELRLDFTGLAADAEVDVLYGSRNFGSQRAAHQAAEVRRIVLSVPISAIRQGANRVMVRTRRSGAKLAGAELWVRRG